MVPVDTLYVVLLCFPEFRSIKDDPWRPLRGGSYSDHPLWLIKEGTGYVNDGNVFVAWILPISHTELSVLAGWLDNSEIGILQVRRAKVLTK